MYYVCALSSRIQLAILHIPSHLLNKFVSVQQFIDILHPVLAIPKQESNNPRHCNRFLLDMFVKPVKILLDFFRGHPFLIHHIAKQVLDVHLLRVVHMNNHICPPLAQQRMVQILWMIRCNE